jgi:hypothetical protein
MREKLKSVLLDDTIFYALLVVSIAVVAFLLGRNSLSHTLPLSAGVQITQQNTVQKQADEQSGRTLVVASRSGTKYHLPTCPGAKQIKESNKITFTSIDEAKAAGYSAAANCDGL